MPPAGSPDGVRGVHATATQAGAFWLSGAAVSLFRPQTGLRRRRNLLLQTKNQGVFEVSKRALSTDKAPAAIGPYSQAVEAGGLLFISGQIPLVPDTGELEQGDFAAHVRRVLDNFEAILSEAGLSWDNVVKTTVYLVDMSRFQEFNALYAERFSADPAARAVVQVAALPRGVALEMEGIAAR